jgi:hypothetical protein
LVRKKTEAISLWPRVGSILHGHFSTFYPVLVLGFELWLMEMAQLRAITRSIEHNARATYVDISRELCTLI